jgi:hypothetical protein
MTVDAIGASLAVDACATPLPVCSITSMPAPFT